MAARSPAGAARGAGSARGSCADRGRAAVVLPYARGSSNRLRSTPPWAILLGAREGSQYGTDGVSVRSGKPVKSPNRASASGRRSEALQVADDVVDLRGRKHTLERWHQRPRLALPYDQPQLLRRPAGPEVR